MKKWLCILFGFAAAAAQADTRDYAYAWTIVPDVGGPAWQVELTPEVYAALTTDDLRDFDVVNNKGESVPTALYRPAVAAPRSPLVALPMFTVPAPPSETPAAGDDAIHLHIERGPDGRLKSLDAATAAPFRRRPTEARSWRAAPAPQALPPFDNRSKIILDASRLHEPLLSLHVDWDRATDATVALRHRRQRRPAKLAHARRRRRRDAPDAGRQHARTPRDSARSRVARLPDADAPRQRRGAARISSARVTFPRARSSRSRSGSPPRPTASMQRIPAALRFFITCPRRWPRPAPTCSSPTTTPSRADNCSTRRCSNRRRVMRRRRSSHSACAMARRC